MGNNSYGYHSMQAANYRGQGRDADAERNEHFMRCDMVDMMIGVDESAKNDYKEASRRYMEYKSRGQETDAERQRHFMDMAMLKMMQRR